jgi:vanillate monooxygenase ferredoxin subunit
MTAFGAPPEGELLTLRVADIRDEAEQIRSFELRDPAGAELPPFEAGAHVRVEVALPNGRAALRHYSLFGDPRDRTRYRIAVLLEPDGRGGSRFMHERVVRGATVRVAAPENGFPLVPEAEHTVLIAGGIGITPILGMLQALAHRGRSCELHYAARAPSGEAFDGVAERHPRGRFYFADREPPELVDLAALLATPEAGTHVYVCGPPGMIRATTSLAERSGWPKRRIHFESFGPKQRAGDRAIEVHLERSALTLRVAPGENILDAVLGARVWAPFECRRGECAACMTRVVAGEPDHRDVCLSPRLREDYMCTCVSRARSATLTLDL